MKAPTKRPVIVHYHIFKNAGSTIDHLLENNFGKAWITFDGAQAHSRIPPAELEEFIRNHPEHKAISSHNAILPVPQMDDVNIAPIFFLRHPIDRVRSIYDFERHQGLTSGPVSRGADHASRLSFEDYLQWRFDFTKNGVTHNFHTAWLLHNPRYNNHLIKQQDFDQALKLLEELPFFGLVERFDESLDLMSAYLKTMGIDLSLEYQIKNSSKHISKPLEDRLAAMREKTDAETWEKILSRNEWDLKLYEAAQQIFKERRQALAANT